MLAMKVATENVRDSITYMFIMKEMRPLVPRGLKVIFHTDASIEEQVVDGVGCFRRRRGWRARMQTIWFVLGHSSFFLPRLLRVWRHGVALANMESAVQAHIET